MSDRESQLQHQNELHKDRQTHKAAVQMASNDRHKIKNPEFLKQLQDIDLDGDLYTWIEDELGPLTSGAFILGNRARSYEEQQMFLNWNKGERIVTERTPGRLIRENPLLNALMQGLQGTERHPNPTTRPEYRDPLEKSRKKRVIRDSMEPITNFQTLSIDNKGLDAASTATVENRTVSNEEQEQAGVGGRIKEVFR